MKELKVISLLFEYRMFYYVSRVELRKLSIAGDPCGSGARDRPVVSHNATTCSIINARIGPL
jgi:hypothetical protein